MKTAMSHAKAPAIASWAISLSTMINSPMIQSHDYDDATSVNKAPSCSCCCAEDLFFHEYH
jgi:hypothetical protein